MPRIREIAQFHTIAFSLVKRDHCEDERTHTLYLLDEEKNPVAYEPFLDYVHTTGRAKSLAWQKEAAYSLGLFIDFIAAKDRHAKKSNQSAPTAKPDPTSLLALFGQALTRGTIGKDGIDPLGIYWEAKSAERATKLLLNVTLFCDWLSARMGTAMVNPWREATYAERIAALRRIDARKPHQLLGYVATQDQRQHWASQARTVGIDRKVQRAAPKEPKIFPDDKVMDLLTKGFVLPASIESDPFHKRIALHNAMITVLMHGGGLRESEPFHLYVSDVGIDKINPNSAEVRLYHPEQGRAPADHVDPITGQRIITDRASYLAQKFGLAPRNRQVGRFAAGFKDLFMMDDKEKYALVHWFPSFWGEVFLSLFKSYIFHCRKRVSGHPYLLVSGKTGYAGDPYTIDSFRQAHGIACRRIGLEPSKDNGTTPHGHRHAYGHALSAGKLDEIFIQRAMHHRSIHSQRVYTAPTQSEMLAALSQAEALLLNPSASSQTPDSAAGSASPQIARYSAEALKFLDPLQNLLSFK